jgi:hypothetical protein
LNPGSLNDGPVRLMHRDHVLHIAHDG